MLPIQFNVGLLGAATLLLSALVACVYFWWFHRHSITDMSPLRKWLALSMRLVIVFLLLLALGGIRWIKRNDTLTVFFLMDASRSIRDDQREQELKFVQQALNYKRKTDNVAIATFGQDPDLVTRPGETAAPQSVTHRGPVSTTNMAQALDFALPLLPPTSGGKVVVLSDGNENVNHALSSVPALAARGVVVDSVVLPSSLKKEALIDRLSLPARVKIGEPFTVKVITSALNGQRGRITLRRDGEPVGPTREVDIPAGKRVHSFDVHLDKPGFYRFEAQLETNPADDTIVENNKGLGFVSVRGKPQILYVADTPTQVPFLQRAMKDQNIEVAYAPPSAMPTSAAAFQQFDSVIISDVPRVDFSEAQMKAMQISTRDFGVGFMMIGGQYSFGAGKYRNTPIEEILPVSLEIKKQKRLPSVAVALVIEDLEMPNVVNMSKEAAKALIDLLDPMDQVGILDCNGFGGFGDGGGGASGTWRVPIQHVVDRAAIQSKVDQLDGMGDPGSYDPFLMEAARALQATDAKVKHIIFLGDGDAAYEGMGDGIRSVMAKIRAMGITVSTVATAADPRGIGYMAQIAKDGDGHAYVADKEQDLPRILLKDQQTISAPPIIEEPFFPKQTPGDDVLQGMGSLPQLLGYNIGNPKPGAGVSLISHRNDPILSSWRYGLGRSVAFMSDDKNRWAINWLPWSGYGQFWAQAIRWTMRSFSPSDFQTEVTTEGTRGHIIVRAIDKDGKFVNRLNFEARTAGPNADASKPLPGIPLRQTAPGTYEAWFDAADIGTYLVNVTRNVQGKSPEMTVTGLVVPYSPEYKDLTANDYLMTQLAQSGGGVMESNPAQAFGGNRPGAVAATDLSFYCLLLAMLLFPIDVAIRRIAIDREEIQRGLNWIRKRFGKAAVPIKTHATSPEIERLKQVKIRRRTVQEKDAILESEDQIVASRPIRSSRQATPLPPLPEPIAVAAEEAVEPTALVDVDEGVAGMSRLMAAKKRAQDQQKREDQEK